MHAVNWRREGLFLAIAGMEACWVVGGTRVLPGPAGERSTGLSWWSVLALFVVALFAQRAVASLQLRRQRWVIGVLALCTSLLLLQANSEWIDGALRWSLVPSTAKAVLILLLGFGIWFRAMWIPLHAGHMRTITRHFQIGVLFVGGLVVAATGLSYPTTDLVVAYFGFGLLAVALTRIEEVAMTASGDAASLDFRWTAALGGTFLLVGGTTILAARLITVETGRALLQPFADLFGLFLKVVSALGIELILLLLPLFQWLFRGLELDELREHVEELQPLSKPSVPEQAYRSPLISPEFAQALTTCLVVALILVALLLLLRAFRRWQVRQYVTPGGVRETVAREGTLAEDLAGFVQDQWKHLRGKVGLRHLFGRLGTVSVRAIYAQMLALMAAADHPRQPEQTPYEFEPIAHSALPARETEITAITEAYVRARYGEMPISAEELARLRDTWKRIQAEERQPS